MGIITLKGVSKFYYKKGIIASGISGINLDLNVGEFVVITGESGSGKTTLLNVISGLDTYEEGEMFIEGKETSHFSSADFEEYRQRYISAIFQDFNLISSYTVYQNIALAMQIEGCDAAEIRRKVPEIIDRVGLSDHRNQKVSKLSGGQKQRVAIARALAKNTLILVADEPTGNLDSESAKGIVELLTEIAADKLVIVVTHNYEQFKEYATRVIRMHDGRVIEDTGRSADISITEDQINKNPTKNDDNLFETGHRVHLADQVKLGVRNTFNLPAKLILLLLVFLFVVSSVSAQYMTIRKQKDTVSEEGWNDYFSNYDPRRIVVERDDRQPFTKADLDAIEHAPHVDTLIREDVMLDSTGFIENEKFIFSGYILNADNIDKEPDFGSLPKTDNEVVLSGPDDGMTFGINPGSIIGETYTVTTDGDVGSEYEITVAGIILTEDNEGKIYFRDPLIRTIRSSLYAANSKTTILLRKSEESCNPGMGGLVVNENVPEGYVLLPTSFDEEYDEGYAAGNIARLRVKALYYQQELELMIMGTYGEKTFTQKTGLENLDEHNGEIYINEMDYRRLYEKGDFQVSVFVDDTANTDGMKDMLERGGFHVLVLKDHIYNYIDSEIVDIIQLPVAIIVSIAVLFIAFFVIRLILKSRGVYFATLRMLGMDKKTSGHIMKIEMVLVCLIAYALFLLFIYLNRIGVLDSQLLAEYLTYLKLRDYVILAVIMLAMAVLISDRFMKTIFRSSAMGAYREEA